MQQMHFTRGREHLYLNMHCYLVLNVYDLYEQEKGKFFQKGDVFMSCHPSLIGSYSGMKMKTSTM